MDYRPVFEFILAREADRTRIQDELNFHQQAAVVLRRRARDHWAETQRNLDAIFADTPVVRGNKVTVPMVLNVSSTQLLLAIDEDHILAYEVIGNGVVAHEYSAANSLGMRRCITCTPEHLIFYPAVNLAERRATSSESQRLSQTERTTLPEAPVVLPPQPPTPAPA